MLQVKLPDGSVKEYPEGTSPRDVAAGIGNTAGQKLLGIQGNGVQVGLNFSGRGPLVSTNVGVGTNVTAGLGNSAAQSLTGLRR